MRVDELERLIHEKFQQTIDVINEIAQRMARYEGEMQVMRDTVYQQTDRVDRFLIAHEEPVKAAKRRRAG